MYYQFLTCIQTLVEWDFFWDLKKGAIVYFFADDIVLMVETTIGLNARYTWMTSLDKKRLRIKMI